jgi:hypothetical protein
MGRGLTAAAHAHWRPLTEVYVGYQSVCGFLELGPCRSREHLH